MRRFVLPVLVLAPLAFGAPAASAHVHGVSNAECARDGAPSGATSQGSQNAPGRPDAPIPRTASDGRTQGQANDADAQGTNC
ncbi:MAG: hypothetical protein M3141_00040 [Actinomycetota bacterium]|nr:hypothetical protein [Actinomycetota bacterium]